ncbi:MAG: HAMP domain-containing histidine kinase [Desulfobacteraceae bacterium]|nr:HAMP domain-containing histidine kinase [Desulfobacteraceae bacterium]
MSDDMKDTACDACNACNPGGAPSLQELSECIYQKVRAKKESYRLYNFGRLQEEAFATFFDLAQEFTTLESLYMICVAVPKDFFDLDGRLYILNPKRSQLELVCTSEKGLTAPQDRNNHGAVIMEKPGTTQDSWLFPIRGNQSLANSLPFLGQHQILGLFEIYPKQKVTKREHFFLEKFTNRIGYNLHQKLLVQQNINHIKFINQLVSDIEHNVITPNLYYKLFLIRLKRMISSYGDIQTLIESILEDPKATREDACESLQNAVELLKTTNQGLQSEHSALSRHYEHTSLFLETLFRKDHFQKGTYVLRKQSCNFRTEIIAPLLDRYSPQFTRKGIAVDDRLENVPDEQVTLFVDKGLISQVFDNFFSNALKYTGERQDQFGHEIKLFSLNRQILKDYFGSDKPGVRFNFFTTGKPLSPEEAANVFEEGFRAARDQSASGSGHGLHFVRNVVEIHGGTVGCEPQLYGNLIYFTLPFKE